MSITTKLARMVIYLVKLLIIKSYKPLTKWSCKVTWQKILYISTTRVPMTNKSIMSRDPLVTWSCEKRGSLTQGGLACKCLSGHWFLIVSFFPSRHFFWTDYQKLFSQRFTISYWESLSPRSDSFFGLTKKSFCKDCSWSCYLWCM